MAREIKIGPHIVNDDSECYIVAEIGHNHQGRLDQAKELFLLAKKSGASAVKLQKRDNRSLYTKEMFDSPYEGPNSYAPTYGEHREVLEFGFEEHSELRRYAREIGITFFATPFDFRSADFLAELDVPAFKLASLDLNNIPLLKYVAEFQKPMIISTGAATIEDVHRAYDAVRPINPLVCLMQCTAEYPAEDADLNLRVITTYRERFSEVVIGYSGHDKGIAIPTAAYTLGARIIEKHFTVDNNLKGTDHSFSLTPDQMGTMVRDLRLLSRALGDGEKRVFPGEQSAIFKMGKKLVAATDLPAGHFLTAEDIAIKSPGDGLPPYELERFIGKLTCRALRLDENISWNDVRDGDGK